MVINKAKQRKTVPLARWNLSGFSTQVFVDSLSREGRGGAALNIPTWVFWFPRVQQGYQPLVSVHLPSLETPQKTPKSSECQALLPGFLLPSEWSHVFLYMPSTSWLADIISGVSLELEVAGAFKSVRWDRTLLQCLLQHYCR